jgi:hypothetical protein
MARTKRTPVQVDEATYARVKQYSDATGVPLARVIDRAVNEWLDVAGKQHMQVLAPSIVTRVRVNHSK